jgi:hypothetical protein
MSRLSQKRTRKEITMNINELFSKYAELVSLVEEIKAEVPSLHAAEKQVEEVKKSIQEWAKANGEASGCGYEVKLSVRGSWDSKALDGYSLAHPEIVSMKTETTVATVRKAK